MKKLILTYIFFFLTVGFSVIYADDINAVQCLNEIQNNNSNNGANGNIVSFPNGINAYSGYYINKDIESSDLTDNYLSGYYYDSTYGFFELNWSETGSNNVHIVSSLDNKCSAGIGYKFSGYARGVDFGNGRDVGYIDFDYGSKNPSYGETYVYYCIEDKKMHGYAYSQDLGFQSFEGITFEIITQGNKKVLLLKKDDPFFVNNFTDILNENYGTVNNNIQGDIITKETGKETIFYIMK